MASDLTDQPSDEVLVQRAQTGALDAFEALTTRHERQVYSLVLRMVRQEQDAEDVTQQTFLSAMENLAAFRGESSFSTGAIQSQIVQTNAVQKSKS